MNGTVVHEDEVRTQAQDWFGKARTVAGAQKESCHDNWVS